MTDDEQIFPIPTSRPQPKLTATERATLKEMEVSEEALLIRAQQRQLPPSLTGSALPIPPEDMDRIKAEAEQWREEAMAQHEATYGKPYKRPTRRKKRGKK